MKKIFIEGRYKGKLNLGRLDLKALPENIGLFTTVQYVGFIPEIKEFLETHGKKVKLIKPKNSRYPGQVLGCSITEFKGVDAFLYVGDGMFHPLALAVRNRQPVFVFNPLSERFSNVSQSHTAKLQRQLKAGLVRFHSSTEIGVLVSTKPGQMRAAGSLPKKFPDKNFYTLAFDTLDFTQLENFPFIECFVNTACSRITYDDYAKFPKPVVDLADLSGL